MSSLYRKGTVSKASGPIHSNSYAMRGVAVRYKTPIFVPELLQLPADWVKPTLPSSQVFTYDYSLERRVAEQARHRAISIAAEASLKREQIAALLKQQQEEEEKEGVGVANDTSPQQPATNPFLLFSTDILTPTPVAPPTSQSSQIGGGGGSEAQRSGSLSAEGGSASSLLEEGSKSSSDQTSKTESVFKSLGNWSIKEFEGDVMDPFEMASLAAINDMEELQSVLQPTVKAPQTVTMAVPTSASNPSMGTSQFQAPAASTALHSSPSPIANPTTAGVYSNAAAAAATNPTPTIASPAPIIASPASIITNPTPALSSSSSPDLRSTATLSIAVAAMGQVPPRNAVARGSNPFMSSEPQASVPNHHSHFTAPVIQAQPLHAAERSRSEPGVGTLVDLGADQLHTKPPVPVPRSPKQQARQQVPIPKPRKGSPAPPSGRGVVQSPPSTSTTATTTITTTPPIPPKGNHLSGGSNSPVPATRIPGSSSPQFSSGGSHNPVRMGVAVLPPITSSAATPLSQPAAINEPPPAYKLRGTPPTVRQASPPPPYSSPGGGGGGHQQQQAHAPALTPPTVARKTYVLPNPEPSLTMDQRKQVETIAGMGFPAQRVGRAILRFEDDQTKVLDFLFLVGELEDAKYNGNSAETALVACKDNLDKAKEYLQKLDMYKEFGFQEKVIHDAYTKSDKGDWDKVLDILMRSR